MYTRNTEKVFRPRFTTTLCAFVLACVALVGVANAEPVTYMLENVVLSDESTLTGSFTIDWDALPHERVTAMSIKHSDGSTNSTGAYITYDPILGIDYPDPVNFGVSGITARSTFDISSGFTLAPYLPGVSGYENLWLLTNDNVSVVGVNKWQVIYIIFNSETGELFLDQMNASNTALVYGSRLHQHTTFPAKDTWATFSETSPDDPDDPFDPNDF